jgi:hypothetical protein
MSHENRKRFCMSRPFLFAYFDRWMKTKSVWAGRIAMVAAAGSLATGTGVLAASMNTLHLALPGATWSLELDAPGFSMPRTTVSPDGSNGWFIAENHAEGMVVSAMVSPAAHPGTDARDARDYYWAKAQKSPVAKTDVRRSETNSAALVEYMIKEQSGTVLDQKHVNAFLSGHGCWADVHVSRLDFKPEFEKQLQSIAASVRFNEQFQPDSRDLADWTAFFVAHQKFPDAARYGEQALQLEQKHPVLASTNSVFLLLNLIIAEGNLGKAARARELSELGLKQHPGYPSFHYNLACAKAELGDRNAALANLKEAFQNKRQLFPGDILPDPAKDASFAKYEKDPEFEKFFVEAAK